MSEQAPYVIHFNPGTGHFGPPLSSEGYLAERADGRWESVPEVRLAKRFNWIGACFYKWTAWWQHEGARVTVKDTRKITPLAP